jgi:phosphate uptake regulator
MKRKIIKQRDSYTVTLPIKWVRNNKIEKDDELNLELKDNALILSSEVKKEELRKIALDATSPHFNDLYLAYCYRAGYDEISLDFKDARIFDKIRDRTSRLIGYEIMDQKADSCSIKSVSAPLSSEFESFFRKLFLTTLDMGESLLSALKNNDLGRLREIRSIERTNNSFYELICRILQKEGYNYPRKSLFLYNINRDIERVCDYYKYMVDNILENKRMKTSKNILDYFSQITKYIRVFYELFYDFDRDKLDHISKTRYDLVKQGYKIYAKSNNKEGIIMFHLINIVQTIFDLVGPVYCMNIESKK